VIDHDNFDPSLGRAQFKAELLLESAEHIRRRVGLPGSGIVGTCEFKTEIIGSPETGLIKDRGAYHTR